MLTPPPSSQRIAAIDAARGFAMVLVCVNHIKPYFEATAPTLHWLVLSTTRIATPVFLLLSGVVIRYLMRTSERANVPVTLVDRALFLLLVAHPLLGLEDLPELGVMHWLFGRAEITDAIGVALLLAVLLRKASASACLLLGVTLSFGSWLIAMTVEPQAPWAKMLGAVLFQIRSADNSAIVAPIVSYVGVFFIGMALSGRLEKPLLEGRTAETTRILLRLGVGAVATALLGVLTWHFAKHQVLALLGDADATSMIREALNPRSKRPPSAGYLLFYGGMGLLLLAMFFHGRPVGLMQPLMRHMAVLGRASLMCFVVQDWLLVGVPHVFGFEDVRSAVFWFAYLAACMAGLYALARAWDAGRGNRLLTVGLKRLISRRGKSLPAYADVPRARDSRHVAG